ncbi:MAG: hypothetical protein K1X71_04245 [Pirellulales bacterium]|nr:hypothetical protein [Pirellulales bacterium]
MAQLASPPPLAATGRRAAARGGRSALVGWLGLNFLPLALILDSAIAWSAGWRLSMDRGFGAIAVAAALFAIASAALMISRRGRGWYRQRAPQLWLWSGATMVALVAGEIWVRFQFPPAGFHLRSPGQFVLKPDSSVFSGVSGDARTAINSQGVRGREMPPAPAYRILCVGAETTECLYLDDSESWPALVEKQLSPSLGREVWVGNAGHATYGSAQHLFLLQNSDWLNRVDCVVALVGAADLLRFVYGHPCDYGRPPFWLRTAMAELARVVWKARLKHNPTFDLEGREIVNFRRRLAPVGDVEHPAAAARAYAARLREIAALCAERGKPLVLVSQPVLWDDPMLPATMQKLCYARTDDRKAEPGVLSVPSALDAMDQYNQQLWQVCQDTGVPLIDAAAQLNGQRDYFFDDVHLNEKGCAALAELVTAGLVKALENRTPPNPQSP